MVWLPAESFTVIVAGVPGKDWSYQRSSTSVPSTYSRAPSSEARSKKYEPAVKTWVRVQRAEKLSFGISGSGLPDPQSKSTAGSSRHSVTGAVRVAFVKYCPCHPAIVVGQVAGETATVIA